MAHTDPNAVIDAYGALTKARDVDGLRALFHPNAVMSGWLGPNMLVGSPDPFFDYVANNAVADSYTAQTTASEVKDGIAMIRIEEENLFGMDFINHFHLVRDEAGNWQITAKLFWHSAPKE
ncbi:MAG: nuclear transport factor 2 family protein [Devosiaceae bacterium]|nr:nuclear transport factor 2 family protein [Devosiaceae bacterium MH13]